jgi:hypothetical protein
MTYCPSQDWDRHVDELDRATEAEMKFYRDHGPAIERIVTTFIRAGLITSFTDDADMVKRAADIAFLIYGEQE